MSTGFAAAPRARPRRIARPMLAAALAVAANAAAADELPSFRKGTWEYVRTIDGGGGKTQTLKSSKCASPTEDMKAQNDRLAKAGCRFSPVVRSGSTYTFSSQCTLQGIAAQSTSVITAEGDSAYRLTVDGTTAGQKTHESMVARRTGDCK